MERCDLFWDMHQGAIQKQPFFFYDVHEARYFEVFETKWLVVESRGHQNALFLFSFPTYSLYEKVRAL